MPEPVEQPTLKPTQKVTAVAGAGAASTVVVFIAGQFGLELGPEVAAALTTLLVFVAGYFRREKS